jgi:hypothetical protein
MQNTKNVGEVLKYQSFALLSLFLRSFQHSLWGLFGNMTGVTSDKWTGEGVISDKLTGEGVTSGLVKE